MTDHELMKIAVSIGASPMQQRAKARAAKKRAAALRLYDAGDGRLVTVPDREDEPTEEQS